MFSGVASQQNNNGSGGLFNMASTAPQQSGGLFSGTTGTNNTTTQPGNTGGLFGTLGAGQAQSKPMFSLGVANPTGGVL
jgi:nucleoporin p58/p45